MAGTNDNSRARTRMLSERTRRTVWQYALLGMCLGVLLLFLVYPILLTVYGAFIGTNAQGESTFTLNNILQIFQDPRLRSGLFNSLRIAATTTTLTIVIGLPLAVLGARYRFPLKSFFNAAILVPLILPPFVGAIGLKALLGREGAINALLDAIRTLLGGEGGLGFIVPGPFVVVGNA